MAAREATKQEPVGHALRWLLVLARPHAGRLSLVTLAVCASSAVTVMMPDVAGRVLDAAVTERSLERLRAVILGLLGLLAVSAALGFAQGYVLRSVAAQLLRGLRERLHAHFLRLSPSFYERERVGDLLSRLSGDVSSIGHALTDNLTGGIQQSLILIGAVAVLLVKSPTLTGMMLLAVPPVVIGAVVFGRRISKLSREHQQAAADSLVTAEEALSGIRTVQAFAREPHERARFGAKSRALLEVALRAGFAWSVFGQVVYLASFSGLVFVLWYGGTMVVAGELSAGELTSFLLYTVMIAAAVGTVTSTWGALQSAAGATARVRELLGTRPEIDDAPDAVAVTRPRGAIRFAGVAFAYPGAPERLALEAVDVDIAPSEFVALVGRSGAGKSTFVSLALRFHDPTHGSVALDGVDLKHVQVASLRAAIGYVPQEVFLFGGTIEENIRYGKLDATEEQIVEAARAAHADEFVRKLKKGYQTIVGERGVRLSAGERQRIAIARVFLKDPSIVVLDEATSALDAESEFLVQSAFERLLEGRTTIVIAHRLSTVRRAQRVLLFDGGRLVEAGSHAELVERNETYRRFVELQMLDPERVA